MSTITDFLPIIIAMLISFFSVRGDTWDQSKHGFLKKIRPSGWGLIIAAFISAAISGYTIQEKNKKISDDTIIRDIANVEIEKGISYLLRPLFPTTNGEKNQEIFLTLQDTTVLSERFESPIVIFNKIEDSEKHPYIVERQQIEIGERMLNDALIKYNQWLDVNIIKKVNMVLEHNFFENYYKFRNADHYTADIFRYKGMTDIQKKHSQYMTHKGYWASFEENRYSEVQSWINVLNSLNIEVTKKKSY